MYIFADPAKGVSLVLNQMCDRFFNFSKKKSANCNTYVTKMDWHTPSAKVHHL